MLVISAISVSVITIYQVSIIKSFRSNKLVFQVVIIVRSYRSSPSRRHLFLSQVLLLGDYDRNLPVTFSNSNAVFVLLFYGDLRVAGAINLANFLVL